MSYGIYKLSLNVNKTNYTLTDKVVNKFVTEDVNIKNYLMLNLSE